RHTRSYGDWSSDVCSSDLSRPDPGGEHGADPGRREVRLQDGLQALDLRDVVDPPGRYPRARRPGSHDPASGPRRRAGTPGDALRSEERRVGKEGRTWVGAE